MQTTKSTLSSLDIFTRAYFTSAAWTNDEDAPGGMDYRDTGRAVDLFDRLLPSEIADGIFDCEKFQRENQSLLVQAGDPEQNGHDFWLSRNGHGAGFWDRGYPDDIGDALTKAAEKFGESYLDFSALENELSS